jgi:hypothetical protein
MWCCRQATDEDSSRGLLLLLLLLCAAWAGSIPIVHVHLTDGTQPLLLLLLLLLQVQQSTAETADWGLLWVLLVQWHAQGGVAAVVNAAGSDIAGDGRAALLLLLLLGVPVTQASLQRMHMTLVQVNEQQTGPHCMWHKSTHLSLFIHGWVVRPYPCTSPMQLVHACAPHTLLLTIHRPIPSLCLMDLLRHLRR